MAASDTHPPSIQFRAMGSLVHIVTDGPPLLLDQGRRRIVALEHMWSRFLPDSEISRINRSADWTAVSADTVTLIEHAVAGWRITGGAFDPTILSSLVSNGYAESMGDTAGRTVLSAPAHRGPAPGANHIEIDRKTSRARLPVGTGFDPGGIGKGLAADLVATELVESGAKAAIVSIGGDVRVAGETPASWVVSVENPFNPDRSVAELGLIDGGVCTSSVYAKTWFEDGRERHHLIEPRTGEPVVSSIVSATVLAAEAWLAEVLAKAAITGDAIGALGFLESAGVEGLLVDVDRVVWRTPGLARFAA